VHDLRGSGDAIFDGGAGWRARCTSSHAMRRIDRIQRIHDRLRRQRFEVLARYRDELARAAEQAGWHEPEDVERATEQWDLRVLDILGEADHRQIVGLSAALERLARGTYGVCQDCGGHIDRARLATLPEAATCIACARALESPAARAAL
jgi:DnaK suppressor protein